MNDYTCPYCNTEIDQIIEDTTKNYYWFYDTYTSKMSYTEGETSEDNKFLCPNCYNEIDFQDFEKHYKEQELLEETTYPKPLLTYEQEDYILESGLEKSRSIH